MNDCITTTKQSTTKPCAYFLGYTVHVHTAQCSGGTKIPIAIAYVSGKPYVTIAWKLVSICNLTKCISATCKWDIISIRENYHMIRGNYRVIRDNYNMMRDNYHVICDIKTIWCNNYHTNCDNIFLHEIIARHKQLRFLRKWTNYTKYVFSSLRFSRHNVICNSTRIIYHMIWACNNIRIPHEIEHGACI